MDPALLTISPLKIKTEDDDMDIIDLDMVKTAEDLVYEWNTKIRMKLKNYYLVEGEETLNMLMKWYIQSLKEEAVNMEDVKSLKTFMVKHLQFFKLYFVELNCCFVDNYLENMEDILAVYLKLEIKSAPRKRLFRKRLCHRIISLLSSLLMNREDRIYHVLMKVKLGLLSEESKDMLNILFRKLLTKQPKDKSDLAFCRSYILYQKWKTCRKSNEWEKMDEVIYNLYDQSPHSVANNATLKKILFPQSNSVLDTLIHLSEKHIIISEEYFKHINSMRLQEETVDLPELREIEINDPILPELVEDDEDREFHTAYNNFVQSMTALSERTSLNNSEGVIIQTDDDDDECQIVGVVSGGCEGTDLVHEILDDGDIEIIYLKKKATQSIPPKEINQWGPSSFLDSIDISDSAENSEEVPGDVDIQTNESETTEENTVEEARLPNTNALVNVELGSHASVNMESESAIVSDNVEASRESVPETEVSKEAASNNSKLPSDKVSSSTSNGSPIDQSSVLSFASASTNTSACDKDKSSSHVLLLHAPSPCSLYSPCNLNTETSDCSATKRCSNTAVSNIVNPERIEDKSIEVEKGQGTVRASSDTVCEENVKTAGANIETEDTPLPEPNLDSSKAYGSNGYEISRQNQPENNTEGTPNARDFNEATVSHDSNLVSESCCVEVSGNLSPVNVNPVVYKSPDTNNESDTPLDFNEETLRGSSPNVASSILCTSTDATPAGTEGTFANVQSKSVTLPCPSPDITSTSTEIQDLRKSPSNQEGGSEVYYDNADNILGVEEYPHDEGSFSEEYLIFSNCDIDNGVNNDNISQSNLQDNEPALIQNEESSTGGSIGSICSPSTSGSPDANLECVQPETIGISEIIIEAAQPLEDSEETVVTGEGANNSTIYATSEKVICDFYKFEENHNLNISSEASATDYDNLNADFDIVDSISSNPQEHASQTPTSSSANSSSDVISPAYEQMDDFGRYYEENRRINACELSPEKPLSRTSNSLDFNAAGIEIAARGKKRSSTEAPRRKQKKIRIAEALVGSSHSVPNFHLQNAPVPQGILKMTSSYDTQAKESTFNSKLPDSTREESMPKRLKLEFIDLEVKMSLLPDDHVIHVLSLNDVSRKFRREKEQAQCSSTQRIVRIDYKTPSVNELDAVQSNVPVTMPGKYNPELSDNYSEVIKGFNSFNLPYVEKKNTKRKGQNPITLNGRSLLVSRKNQEIGVENNTKRKPGRKRKKGVDT